MRESNPDKLSGNRVELDWQQPVIQVQQHKKVLPRLLLTDTDAKLLQNHAHKTKKVESCMINYVKLDIIGGCLLSLIHVSQLWSLSYYRRIIGQESNETSFFSLVNELNE